MEEGRALGWWKGLVSRRRRLARKALQVTRRWRGLDLRSGWLTWVDFAEHMQREREEATVGLEQQSLQQALRAANDELTVIKADNSKLLRGSRQGIEQQEV